MERANGHPSSEELPGERPAQALRLPSQEQGSQPDRIATGEPGPDLQIPPGFNRPITRRKLLISLALGALVLAFSHSVWGWMGASFPGLPLFRWIGPALASLLFVYAGTSFLRLSWRELRRGRPGMMTLVSLAVCLTYAFNVLLLFKSGRPTSFWELAILIDLLLFLYWIGSYPGKPAAGKGTPMEDPGILDQIALQIQASEERNTHDALLDELVALEEQEASRRQQAKSKPKPKSGSQPKAVSPRAASNEEVAPNVQGSLEELKEAANEMDGEPQVEEELEEPAPSRLRAERDRREQAKQKRANVFAEDAPQDDQHMTRQMLHEEVERLKEPPKGGAAARE